MMYYDDKMKDIQDNCLTGGVPGEYPIEDQAAVIDNDRLGLDGLLGEAVKGTYYDDGFNDDIHSLVCLSELFVLDPTILLEEVPVGTVDDDAAVEGETDEAGSGNSDDGCKDDTNSGSSSVHFLVRAGLSEFCVLDSSSLPRRPLVGLSQQTAFDLGLHVRRLQFLTPLAVKNQGSFAAKPFQSSVITSPAQLRLLMNQALGFIDVARTRYLALHQSPVVPVPRRLPLPLVDAKALLKSADAQLHGHCERLGIKTVLAALRRGTFSTCPFTSGRTTSAQMKELTAEALRVIAEIVTSTRAAAAARQAAEAAADVLPQPSPLPHAAAVAVEAQLVKHKSRVIDDTARAVPLQGSWAAGQAPAEAVTPTTARHMAALQASLEGTTRVHSERVRGGPAVLARAGGWRGGGDVTRRPLSAVQLRAVAARQQRSTTRHHDRVRSARR